MRAIYWQLIYHPSWPAYPLAPNEMFVGMFAASFVMGPAALVLCTWLSLYEVLAGLHILIHPILSYPTTGLS